jgi:hypothetical protein
MTIQSVKDRTWRITLREPAAGGFCSTVENILSCVYDKTGNPPAWTCRTSEIRYTEKEIGEIDGIMIG